MYCPKGCERAIARFQNGAMTFQGVSDAYGFSEQRVSSQVAAPNGMAGEYAAMTRLTPMAQHPPTLEFYNDLHDVGGIFSGADWVIMVGVADMQRIANKVLAEWAGPAEQVYMAHNRGMRPNPQALFHFVKQAATVRCMAHELGHALIFTGLGNPYWPDGEAGADYCAGRLDAARGRSRDLGQMFFWSIGCVGPSCDHPTPDARASAYVAGFDEQLAAA
jgi:hypothetical protein